MRRNLEPLLHRAGVDIVLNGHVHSYERTAPVFDREVEPCGVVHLNLGDGGNREGAYIPWKEPQPEWSMFREASFGVGRLLLHNATHAEYLWARHACMNSDSPQNIRLDPASVEAT